MENNNAIWNSDVTFYLEVDWDEAYDVAIRMSVNGEPSDEEPLWVSYPHDTETEAFEAGANKLEQFAEAMTYLGIDGVIEAADKAYRRKESPYE